MRIDFTDPQKLLRAELRTYFGALLTPEVRAVLSGPDPDAERRRVFRRMGSDGWLGVGWPREYGGQGRSAVEQLIWFDEARRAGAPLPFVTLNTVGPTLMAMGTDAQKRRFLPAILSGEIQFAIGYTEPGAGTDLAALETRAVREGSHYVVNGTKVFTSGADSADFIWLACRTDSEAPKHRGISILMVDTSLPGFSWAPIRTVGDAQTTVTYYRDVRVPVEMLVGEEHRGWKLITLQLNHERIGLAAMSGIAGRLLEDTLDWVAGSETDEGPLGETPWVQACLGEAWARLESVKVMNWQMAWELEQGRLAPARASAVKVHGSETLIEVYRLLLEVVGPSGLLKRGSVGAVLEGELEQEWRRCQINTFGGGVNEIQREIVATMGLGVPRAPR